MLTFFTEPTKRDTLRDLALQKLDQLNTISFERYELIEVKDNQYRLQTRLCKRLHEETLSIEAIIVFLDLLREYVTLESRKIGLL